MPRGIKLQVAQLKWLQALRVERLPANVGQCVFIAIDSVISLSLGFVSTEIDENAVVAGASLFQWKTLLRNR